jgi:plastocyanin
MGAVRTLTAVAVIGAMTLCMAAPSAPTRAASPALAQVLVNDFMFQPTSLTVPAGTTVTWTNKDDEPHTVRSDTGLFGSGAMDTNESFSFKFEKAGTYHFTCSIHPRMVGTIIVQ